MATMERIVLALGARGLVNAQFIVRDDGVYLIEVNPRASRTVPFMSKVTGVPMVELAVRISLGATLAGARLGRRPARAAAVRRGQGAGVLDGQAARRRPVGRAGDAVDRRGHRDPRRTRGWRWPRRCSARRSCRRGRAATGALALLSIADRDKATLPRLAAALAAAGYRLAATPGTRDGAGRGRLRGAAGGQARRGGRTRRPARSPILDLIASGEVRLVVNTPTPRSGAVRDAAEIRLAATAEGILCLTAIETAVAAAEALDPAIAGRLAEVRSLGEWVPARPRGRR